MGNKYFRSNLVMDGNHSIRLENQSSQQDVAIFANCIRVTQTNEPGVEITPTGVYVGDRLLEGVYKETIELTGTTTVNYDVTDKNYLYFLIDDVHTARDATFTIILKDVFNQQICEKSVVLPFNYYIKIEINNGAAIFYASGTGIGEPLLREVVEVKALGSIEFTVDSYDTSEIWEINTEYTKKPISYLKFYFGE